MRAIRRVGADRAAGVLLMLGGLAMVLAAGAIVFPRYSGDPSIYFAYAREFRHGGFYAFNPGAFSSGSTSPLWPLLLAIPGAIGSKVGAELGALKAFSLLWTAAAFLVTVAAARRAGGAWLGAALAGLFVVTSLTLFGAMGYEAGMTVTAVAVSILAADRLVSRAAERPIRLRDGAPLFVAWAVLPLAHPDATLLVPLELLALWAFAFARGRRELRVLLAGAAAAAVPAVLYYGYSLVQLGVPSTSMAGRALFLREAAIDRIGPLYTSRQALDYLTSDPAVWVVLPALAGLVLLWRDPARRWLAAYAGGALVAYVLLLTFVAPGFFDTDRYLLPLAPLLVAAAAATLAALQRRRAAWPLVAAAAVALTLPAAKVPLDRAPATRDLPTNSDAVFNKHAADVVDRMAAPGDTVLAYEVQVRLDLRRDLDVLSLDGITDGKVLPYAERRHLDEFLLRYRPRYWIADTSTDPQAGGLPIRPYLRDSALYRAVLRFRAKPSLAVVQVGGIRFRRLARRTVRPGDYYVGAWTWVFELGYPARSRAIAPAATSSASPITESPFRSRG